MKTRKLKCIITGKVLAASVDYYNKKIEKAGSEEELHKTYICREAKSLLSKGYTIEQVKQQLGSNEDVVEVPSGVIKEITTNEFGLKKNTMFSGISSFTHIETDPGVKDFINKIYEE